MRRYIDEDETPSKSRRSRASDDRHGFGSPVGMELATVPERQSDTQGAPQPDFESYTSGEGHAVVEPTFVQAVMGYKGSTPLHPPPRPRDVAAVPHGQAPPQAPHGTGYAAAQTPPKARQRRQRTPGRRRPNPLVSSPPAPQTVGSMGSPINPVQMTASQNLVTPERGTFSDSDFSPISPSIALEYDSASVSDSSVNAPFTGQVETLNDLLLSTDRRLGNLGRTRFSPLREDDNLDEEERDLEEVRRQLQQELSEVNSGIFEPFSLESTPERSTAVETPNRRILETSIITPTSPSDESDGTPTRVLFLPPSPISQVESTDPKLEHSAAPISMGGDQHGHQQVIKSTRDEGDFGEPSSSSYFEGTSLELTQDKPQQSTPRPALRIDTGADKMLPPTSLDLDDEQESATVPITQGEGEEQALEGVGRRLQQELSEVNSGIFEPFSLESTPERNTIVETPDRRIMLSSISPTSPSDESDDTPPKTQIESTDQKLEHSAVPISEGGDQHGHQQVIKSTRDEGDFGELPFSSYFDGTPLEMTQDQPQQSTPRPALQADMGTNKMLPPTSLDLGDKQESTTVPFAEGEGVTFFHDSPDPPEVPFDSEGDSTPDGQTDDFARSSSTTSSSLRQERADNDSFATDRKTRGPAQTAPDPPGRTAWQDWEEQVRTSESSGVDPFPNIPRTSLASASFQPQDHNEHIDKASQTDRKECLDKASQTAVKRKVRDIGAFDSPSSGMLSAMADDDDKWKIGLSPTQPMSEDNSRSQRLAHLMTGWDKPDTDASESDKVETRTRVWRLCCILCLCVIAASLALGIGVSGVLRDDAPGQDSSPVPTSSPSLDLPTTSPTVSPHSDSPISTSNPTLPVIDLDIEYEIKVKDGLVDNIERSAYEDDLVESMDHLSQSVVDSLSTRRVRRRLPPSVLLPTSIDAFEVIPCSYVTVRDRCERVHASISLVEAESSWVEFQLALEDAIENGELQDTLDEVNPESPAEVLGLASNPPTEHPVTSAPSPALDPRTETPTTTPSSSPTGTPSGRPTESPSGIPTDSPTESTTGIPTESPTENTSGFPTESPTDNPTGSPTGSPSALSTPPTESKTEAPTQSTSASPTVHSPTAPPTDTSATPTAAPGLLDFLIDNSFDGGEALEDPTSPQYQAYLWLVGNSDLDDYSEQRLLQRYAMATLYYNTDGDSWFFNEGWLTDLDECDWYSKTSSKRLCNPKKELQFLELDYNDLGGVLPPELGLLSNSLETLILLGGPMRFMTGQIPSELGYLTKLTGLFLRGNQHSGLIPSELGLISVLEQFDVAVNNLDGPIPTEIGELTELASLDLSTNKLTGPIPSEIGHLQVCTKLAFEDNSLSGPIPTEIGHLQKMRHFSAGANLLSAVPTQLGNMAGCESLSLQENNLQGSLPTTLGDLRYLSLLDLGHNGFTGMIPTEIGMLTELRDRLDLSYNQLSGELPTVLGNLSHLRLLKLQHNRLSGEIPSGIDGLTRVATIRLDSNSLSGGVPDDLCRVFNRTYPAFYTDCSELTDDCPCCTHCCVDSVGCECRYQGTDNEFQCYHPRLIDNGGPL